MLSNDELSDGITFILQLRDARGEPVQWAQKLSGDAARHWFEVYRRSDWDGLKVQAGGVFHAHIDEQEAERLIRAERCVVISTTRVNAEEIVASPVGAA